MMSLNPCCNGMTIEFSDDDLKMMHAIRLNPCCNGMTIEFCNNWICTGHIIVLILVVME